MIPRLLALDRAEGIRVARLDAGRRKVREDCGIMSMWPGGRARSPNRPKAPLHMSDKGGPTAAGHGDQG